MNDYLSDADLAAAQAAASHGLSDAEIKSLTPETAKEILAGMQARYTAAKPVDPNTRDGIRGMTPAVASAALEKMDLSLRPTDANGKPIPKPPIVSIKSSDEILARNVAEAFADLENRGIPARGTDVW
jgi:hypothetical protein